MQDNRRQGDGSKDKHQEQQNRGETGSQAQKRVRKTNVVARKNTDQNLSSAPMILGAAILGTGAPNTGQEQKVSRRECLKRWFKAGALGAVGTTAVLGATGCGLGKEDCGCEDDCQCQNKDADPNDYITCSCDNVCNCNSECA